MKVYDYAISLLEFPDEIALCLDISNCPCKCEGCSSKHLQEDIGDIVSEDFIDKLIKKYSNYGITLIGFLGGDRSHEDIYCISKYIKSKYNLKIGFYSGLDCINIKLIAILDYYKYGRFILPKGQIDSWWKQVCGPINFPQSNQKLFKIENNNMIDITYRLKQPISDLSRYIIKN